MSGKGCQKRTLQVVESYSLWELFLCHPQWALVLWKKGKRPQLLSHASSLNVCSFRCVPLPIPLVPFSLSYGVPLALIPVQIRGTVSFCSITMSFSSSSLKESFTGYRAQCLHFQLVFLLSSSKDTLLSLTSKILNVKSTCMSHCSLLSELLGTFYNLSFSFSSLPV